MKREEFRQAVPPMPQHFVQRMNDTLGRIENMKKRKTRKGMGVLLAAVLMALAMMGTAAATTRLFGLLDMKNRGMNGPKTLNGAEELVQTDFEGGWHCENGTIQVVKAIYTGKSYAILLHTSFETMYPEWELLNAEEGTNNLHDATVDGEMDFTLGGTLMGDAPEILKLKISVPVYRNGEVLTPVEIPLELPKTGGETARLIPIDEAADWKVIEASLTNNPFVGSLDVIFQCDEAKQRDWTVILLDEEGNRITQGGGTCMESTPLPDGSIAYRDSSEVQSFEALPDKLILQLKEIGEERWLDPIECEVVKE